MTDPFDVSLPSPLARLAQLRARASEAVVRDAQSSDVQQLMAPSGGLEDDIWDLLGSADAPDLLVLTGSAGSGKSALINHLLERNGTDDRRLGEHLADATHADAPDQDQAQRLADFLAPFADGNPRPGGPCRVVAMNTGLALWFFNDLGAIESPPPLVGLEVLLRRRLGLPPSAGPVAEWMEAAVLVVNLDHRPTAGREGDLFDALLARLDPGSPDGVLEGAPRCATCSVREWCWPTANAGLVSSRAGRAALNAAAGDITLTRGRQLAPRALWDTAADLCLSGLDVDSDDLAQDPCFGIAAVAAAADEDRFLSGMACGSALAKTGDGSLTADISSRDPGYLPSLRAHALVSDAGLDPSADADCLATWLSGDGPAHPAAEHAARILRQGRAPFRTGRLMARAAWLAGGLEGGSGLPPEFADALHAQAMAASADDGTPDGERLYEALDLIEDGLAEVFGLTSGPDKYYPTSTPSPGATADLLVQVQLVGDGHLVTHPDPVSHGNLEGSRLVGYRPLALSLRVDTPGTEGPTREGRHVYVDYPLWSLLRQAAAGGSPSSVELERFLALRQAIRVVGVAAAADRSRPRPLLVRERGAGGRRFRVVVRNAATGAMRANEVL
jgi:hypothetical protein